MDGYYKKRVIEAMDNEDKLSEWEWDFVNSLADRGDDYQLSKKQIHILNRIAEKMV